MSEAMMPCKCGKPGAVYEIEVTRMVSVYFGDCSQLDCEDSWVGDEHTHPTKKAAIAAWNRYANGKR